MIFLLPELFQILCWQQSELPLECKFKQVVYKTLGRCNCISFKAGYIAYTRGLHELRHNHIAHSITFQTVFHINSHPITQ